METDITEESIIVIEPPLTLMSVTEPLVTEPQVNGSNVDNLKDKFKDLSKYPSFQHLKLLEKNRCN